MDAEIQTQYRAVREEAGILDRSEMGKIAVHGTDRFPWLQGMVSNDTRLLENEQEARLPACILDPTGHLLSDVVLINVLGDDPYVLIELPRQNVDRILSLLDRFVITEEVELRDVTDALACLSYQGPAAVRQFRDRKRESGLDRIDPRVADTIAVEADHTGSGGWDTYFHREMSDAMRAHRIEHDSRTMPLIAAEAQEILRVEAGLPKYGVDMDESVIALEANLGDTHISLTKGCYVGQEIIARIDSRGHTNRALTGLVIDGQTLPASGDTIVPFSTDGAPTPRETGRITSVVASAPAAHGRPIALGYVRHEHRAPDTRLRLLGDGRETVARVVELPFYRKPSP